jgi:hypothetical protein
VLGGIRAGLPDGDHHPDPLLLAHADAGEPAAEPAAHAGQGRGLGEEVQVQGFQGRRAAVGDQDGDVVGPALWDPHPLGDRGGQPGRRLRLERLGVGQDVAGHRCQPAEGRVGYGATGRDGPVREQDERRALLEDVLGHGRLCAGQGAERRPRDQREERRAAVGVHDQRRRVPGRAVGEVARAGVEHGVADRRALDVLHLRGEGVERGEDVGRRGVALRGGAEGAPQPAHRARSRDTVPDRVADDECQPPGAQGDRVVPITAGRLRGGRAVVAAREPDVGQHRQGRRQQRQLRLVDPVGRRLRPQRGVGGVVGLEQQQRARTARHAHRADDDGRCRTVGTERTCDGLRSPGTQHAVDQVGDGPAVDGGQVAESRAQGPGPGVGPDRRAVTGGEAVDRCGGALHGHDQDASARVPSIGG